MVWLIYNFVNQIGAESYLISLKTDVPVIIPFSAILLKLKNFNKYMLLISRLSFLLTFNVLIILNEFRFDFKSSFLAILLHTAI